jgi:hypothetical protein
VRELNIPQTLRPHLHHINQKLGTYNHLEVVTHVIRRNSFKVRHCLSRTTRSTADRRFRTKYKRTIARLLMVHVQPILGLPVN